MRIANVWLCESDPAKWKHLLRKNYWTFFESNALPNRSRAQQFKTVWFLFLQPNYHLLVKFLFEIIKTLNKPPFFPFNNFPECVAIQINKTTVILQILDFLGGCKYDIFHRYPLLVKNLFCSSFHDLYWCIDQFGIYWCVVLFPDQTDHCCWSTTAIFMYSHQWLTAEL